MKRFPLLVCLLLLLLLIPAGVPAANTTTTTKTVATPFQIPSGPPTITSINPSSGDTNTSVSITALGTNIAGAAGVRLRRSSSSDIVGSVKSATGTSVVADFNLNNRDPGEYQVCVFNNASSFTCGLSFTIRTPAETSSESSIFFESNPTGATVFLNGTNIGTTVFTYRNATPGTFKVLLRKSGYEDYTDSVTVTTGGGRVKFYARLTPQAAGAAAAPATTVTTATTIRKSTLKVPTTWPSTTPTEASPVDPAIVIGAAGIAAGLVAIRRR